MQVDGIRVDENLTILILNCLKSAQMIGGQVKVISEIRVHVDPSLVTLSPTSSNNNNGLNDLYNLFRRQ